MTKQKQNNFGQQKHKLGLMSCILVVIGACIGAGIFFKNGSILANTQHSLVLSLLCWVIAGLGVLAMGLALTEVVSGCRKPSNLGVANWVKTFNSSFLYKSCRNFFCFAYPPLILTALAYYFVQALFSAINPLVPSWTPEWWQVALASLFILTWFFFTSGISIRWFNRQNWVIMCFKFIPLVFAIVIGYIIFNVRGGLPSETSYLPSPEHNTAPFLTDYSPVLGIVASIPAIFFAFNGFQYPASMTSHMKNPKQLPLSMLIGIVIVIVVYVLISLSLILSSSTGGVDGLHDWLKGHNVEWIYSLVYILIGVGILSVINGTINTTVNNYEEFIRLKEIPLSNKIQSLCGRTNNLQFGAAIYAYVITIIFFVVATIVGCFFIQINQPSEAHFDSYSLGIFCFTDILSNWCALFIYIFIGISFIGCLVNRKTRKVKVTKSKVFVPTAIISVVLIGVSTLYLIVQIFTDLGLAIYYYQNQTSYGTGVFTPTNIDKHWIEQIVSKVMMIVAFFMYIGITFLPALISEKHQRHKHR